MRSLLLPAVLLVGSLSGCLAPLQDALEIVEEPSEPVMVEPDHVHLTYESIPDERGAYQFQIPNGAQSLTLRPIVADEEDDDEDDENEASPTEPEAPESSEETESEDEERDELPFALYTVGGDRIDPTSVDDEGSAYVLDAPAAGGYVLVLRGHVGSDLEMEVEAATANVTDGAGGVRFHGAILPLTQMTMRVPLLSRSVGDDEASGGRVEFPFVPDSFGFAYDGAGTRFHGVISSDVGVVYQHEESFPVGTGGSGTDPNGPPMPCCSFGFYAPMDDGNLEGLGYEWEIETDLIGDVTLFAWLHQPAPPSALPVEVNEIVVVEDETDGVELSVSYALEGEYFYSGEAKPDGRAYTFTVPNDAEALLMRASPTAPPSECSFGSSAPACAHTDSARISLYDAEGRVGLFAVEGTERLEIPGIAPGTYAAYVHGGTMEVAIGIEGAPPADGRLHGQLLRKLASVDAPLTQTAPFTAPVDVTGIVMTIQLKTTCPDDRGLAFTAQAVSPAGVALYATKMSMFSLFPDSCFGDGASLEWVAAETIVPGAYTLDVDATGGSGTATFQFFGLESLDRERDEEPEESGGTPTSPVPSPHAPLGEVQSRLA